LATPLFGFFTSRRRALGWPRGFGVGPPQAPPAHRRRVPQISTAGDAQLLLPSYLRLAFREDGLSGLD